MNFPDEQEQVADEEQRLPALESLDLRRTNVIADFDKRIDFLDWRAKRSVVNSTLKISGKDNAVSVDVSEESSGWPWIEINFPSGGRLIVCGFGMIDQWEFSPAPRSLLWHILARAVHEPIHYGIHQ